MSDSASDRIARDPWHGFERVSGRTGALDKAFLSVDACVRARWTAFRGRACRQIVSAVRSAEPEFSRLDDKALAARARILARASLRTEIGRVDIAAPIMAAICEASSRHLGKRHFDVQLMGGLAMLRGQLAEMQTGEGKTLTATLAAGAMALSGRPVHVVTVNDYLAKRDAEEMTPVYEALGLSVGLVVQGMEPDARRRAYDADVTYCTNKELAFDYLRDRIDNAGGLGRHARRARHVHGRHLENGAPGLLRGLAFALIDEADSILIDEARTPLILSGEGPSLFGEDLLREAVDASSSLSENDYLIHKAESRIELRPAGLRKLEANAGSGKLSNRVIREELVIKALSARHLFRADEHYLVRDGQVVIIDEYTGRVMPDRFWSDGLHQLIELKEGLELSRGRVTLARTTYQSFFRRYDRISGLSGTASEVARELWQTFRLPVATIPTHRLVQRIRHPAKVFPTAAEKWTAIAHETRRQVEAGLPVLIGTRSVTASQSASEALRQHGIEHVVLSASQDAEEAEIIARAGQMKSVTVATNMAGRGADIKLGKGVADLGGLQVIMSEYHDSRRIDRQLAGRAGRQGDKGDFRPFLSLDDPLIKDEQGSIYRWLRALSITFGIKSEERVFGRAQARAEALHARMRRDLLRQDEVMNDALAFSGKPD